MANEHRDIYRILYVTTDAEQPTVHGTKFFGQWMRIILLKYPHFFSRIFTGKYSSDIVRKSSSFKRDRCTQETSLVQHVLYFNAFD